MRQRYVALEGNIGAGKTTLAKKLAETMDARLVLEEFTDNPFLALFYENPGRYAFSLEMAFLADRYHQLGKINDQDMFQPLTIADYSIYKSLIFAQNNLKMHELDLYRNLFRIIADNLRQPDLVIYLNRSIEVLQKHIKQRGRSYEQHIQSLYLKDIHDNYTEFFKQNKSIHVVVIDADRFDFINNEADFNLLQNLVYQNFKPGLNFLG